MSVFQPGTDATDKLFLEYIKPGLETQVEKNTRTYNRFKTDSESVLGKYAVFKAMTRTPRSARPSSSSTFPTAKQGVYDEFIIYMKRGLYDTLQFDNLALACSKGKGAVMSILKAEMDGQTLNIGNKLNRQYLGDGSGRLAQVNGAVSNSTSVEVNGPSFGQDSNDYTNPARYLDEGQVVDVYDTSGNLEAEEIEISTIVDNGDGTATLTMAENVTLTDDAYIFDHDTYASSQAAGTGVPMGIHGMIEASDPYTGITETSFQNIDRDTYSWARAQEVNMASAAPTNRKILETIQAVEKFGQVKVLLTNAPIWNSIYEIWETDKTMPNETVYWGGTEGLCFYGGRKGKIPIIYDDDVPDNIIFAIDDQYIKIYSPTKNGLEFLKGPNGVLQQVQGKDEYVVNLRCYYNMGTPKPQALGKLYNVKHASS